MRPSSPAMTVVPRSALCGGGRGPRERFLVQPPYCSRPLIAPPPSPWKSKVKSKMKLNFIAETFYPYQSYYYRFYSVTRQGVSNVIVNGKKNSNNKINRSHRKLKNEEDLEKQIDAFNGTDQPFNRSSWRQENGSLRPKTEVHDFRQEECEDSPFSGCPLENTSVLLPSVFP